MDADERVWCCEGANSAPSKRFHTAWAVSRPPWSKRVATSWKNLGYLSPNNRLAKVTTYRWSYARVLLCTKRLWRSLPRIDSLPHSYSTSIPTFAAWVQHRPHEDWPLPWCSMALRWGMIPVCRTENSHILDNNFSSFWQSKNSNGIDTF